MRKNGATVVVVVAHVGLKCSEELAPLPARLKRASESSAKCGAKNEMTELLASLPQEPQNKIDAVVSGHSHSVVNHFINSIPVIQSGGGGKMIHAIHLKIDPHLKKVIEQETAIEGPVPLCSEVHQKTLDCKPFAENQSSSENLVIENHNRWMTPTVNGHPVVKDLQMEKILAPIFEKTAKIKSRVLAEADRPIHRDPHQESALGNLVADTLRDTTGADFGIINAFGIRENFDQGPITYEEVFNALPFDNRIGVVEVNGLQLRQILRIAVSGANGTFPTSGFELTLTKGGGQKEDLNGDGEFSPWEVNRLIKAVLRKKDGSVAAIEDEKTYTLALNDFLLEGGDDLLFATSQISADKKRFGPKGSAKSYGFMRDALEKYLEKKGHINSVAEPLIDSNAPRLIFQ